MAYDKKKSNSKIKPRLSLFCIKRVFVVDAKCKKYHRFFSRGIHKSFHTNDKYYLNSKNDIIERFNKPVHTSPVRIPSENDNVGVGEGKKTKQKRTGFRNYKTWHSDTRVPSPRRRSRFSQRARSFELRQIGLTAPA